MFISDKTKELIEEIYKLAQSHLCKLRIIIEPSYITFHIVDDDQNRSLELPKEAIKVSRISMKDLALTIFHKLY